MCVHRVPDASLPLQETVNVRPRTRYDRTMKKIEYKVVIAEEFMSAGVSASIFRA